MLWEHLLNGMAASMWVIGFLAALGLFLLIIAAFCAIMMCVFGEENENESTDTTDTADETGYPCDLPVRIEPLGRHMRKDS